MVEECLRFISKDQIGGLEQILEHMYGTMQQGIIKQLGQVKRLLGWERMSMELIIILML